MDGTQGMLHITPSRVHRTVLFGAIVAGLLAACGADQIAGIQGSGSPVAASYTTVGPVSGFGSIFVDGVEYTTSAAQIRIDDQPAMESQLRVGQVVSIRGSVNADGSTTVAAEVSFAADLRGPVTQVDVATATFTTLGQQVHVTDATVFGDSVQPADVSAFANGDLVEISGFADASGKLFASRIDRVAQGAPLQVKGQVQQLDAAAGTFRLNSLTVDYSGIAPSGTLANGATVIVRGGSVNAGVLAAQSVQVIGPFSPAANDKGMFEGIVTTFTSNTDFSVNGVTVTTNASTQFVLRGLTLGANLPVKVRGTFNAAGVLVADRVEVRPTSLSVVRGLVEDVSAGSASLSVLGIAVSTDSTTAFEDRMPQPLRQFQLDDVRTGDYVEVRGVPNSSGNGLVATLVLRVRAENASYLQGVASNVLNPSFTLLGTMVSTEPQTLFLGLGGPQVGADAFFAAAAGRSVLARGQLVGGVFVADRLQIRN